MPLDTEVDTATTVDTHEDRADVVDDGTGLRDLRFGVIGVGAMALIPPIVTIIVSLT
jgi:hypothetical protein